MQVKLRKIFTGVEPPKNTRFIFDKTSITRPAWIQLNNLPENIMFISTLINGKIQRYRNYLPTKNPLFLPVDYTKEEMRKFYNQFAKNYDKNTKSRNSKATQFLFEQIEIPKNAKILDLGAGSGISTVPLIKKGYNKITLIDFSEEMLELAKQKKELKNCKFIREDITQSKLKDKFNVVYSVFSFGSNSYFTPKEMPKLWIQIANYLEKQGKLLLIGYDYEPPKKLFKKIKSGKYEIIPNFKVEWYLGEKIN